MTYRGLVVAVAVVSGTLPMTAPAAAAVVPRSGQLAWQQRPVTDFGVNTFTDREWGSGAEKEPCR